MAYLVVQRFGMGVVGAALATVVGQYAGLAVLLQAAAARSKVRHG